MKATTLSTFFFFALLIMGCNGVDTEVGTRDEELMKKWKMKAEENKQANASLLAIDAMVADWLAEPNHLNDQALEFHRGLAISNAIISGERMTFFRNANSVSDKMMELGKYDPEKGIFANPDADQAIIDYMSTPSIPNSITQISPGSNVWATYENAVGSYSNLSKGQFESGNFGKDPLADFPSLEPEERARWQNWDFTSSSPLDVLLNIELLKEDILKRGKAWSDAIAGALKIDISGASSTETTTAQKPTIKCLTKSDTVYAGIKYECELVVEGLPQGADATFSGNLSIQEESPNLTIGSATAPGGFRSGENYKTQTVPVQARYLSPDGSEVILNENCRYVIARPTAVMQPTAGSALKLNKPQKITIDVPGLGEFYNPEIQSEGAKIEISPSNKRHFTITPQEKVVEIQVFSLTNGQRIHCGNYQFTAK